MLNLGQSSTSFFCEANDTPLGLSGIRVWRIKKGRSHGLRRLIHQRLTLIQPHLVSRQTPIPPDAMDAIERLGSLSGEIHILSLPRRSAHDECGGPARKEHDEHVQVR